MVSPVPLEKRDFTAPLGSKRPLVPDDLDARDPSPVQLLECNALAQEEAALHPLVGHRPSHVSGRFPGADQPTHWYLSPILVSWSTPKPASPRRRFWRGPDR